ncbi:MAG: hypothetical protein ACTSRY_04605 [Alphaproteobacteria bacterium]
MDEGTNDTPASVPEGAEEAPRQPHGAGRRRFLLGGAAAPVILTLASRPALAANCEPCGFMELSASATASAAARVETCGGANTEYWKYDIAAWEPTGYDPGSRTRLRGRDRLEYMLRQLRDGADDGGEGGAFGGAFSEDMPGPSAVATVDEMGRPIPRWRGGTKFHNVFPGAAYGSKSLMQVLWGHPESLGAYASAALLNASDGGARKYPLPATQIIDIYYQIEAYGYYQTANDFKMDRQKAIDFFRNTFS